MELNAKNLNTLPVLRALLEHVSVVGAANEVGLSQPTVSGILRRLRTDFDDALLIRDGRGMKLTTRAEQLRPVVSALCEQLEGLYAPPQFDPSALSDLLVIAAPDHLAFLLSSGLRRRLEAETAGARIQFVNVPHDLDDRLDRGDVDLAVCGNFDMWPRLAWKKLFVERIATAVDERHPLAGRANITVDDLSRFPIATMGGSAPSRSAAPVTGVPSFDATTPRVVLSQFTDAVLLTIDSDIVAPAPEPLIDHLTRMLPITKVELAEANEVVVGMFWTEARSRDPALMWLGAAVQSVATELASQWSPA